jgi:hypothetical protein
MKQMFKSTYDVRVFGWGFAPAFAFAKAKSQPKDLNALDAFA